jgi:hypothetical protein
MITGTNWEILDSDIFSTYNVPTQVNRRAIAMCLGVYSWHVYYPEQVFYSGMTQHADKDDMTTWWNQSNWQSPQFGLVRGNTALHGASPMAGGSNIATYEGGDAHHMYLGGNSWAHTYGNDREVMTYDDAGTTYTGPLLGVSADGMNITLRGGNFSVINPGTGADQDHEMHTGAKSNVRSQAICRWLLCCL